MNNSILIKSMLSEMQRHVRDSMSINISGVPHTGEGADFK